MDEALVLRILCKNVIKSKVMLFLSALPALRKYFFLESQKTCIICNNDCWRLQDLFLLLPVNTIYSFIHTLTTSIHAHKFLNIFIWKLTHFVSTTKTLLNFKPQPNDCILVMAHFTAHHRDGLESWYRVQGVSKKLFCRDSRKPHKLWATLSQWQTDRQTDRDAAPGFR